MLAVMKLDSLIFWGLDLPGRDTVLILVSIVSKNNIPGGLYKGKMKIDLSLGEGL